MELGGAYEKLRRLETAGLLQSANTARELRAINAQTAVKAEEHQRPESKTNQQDRQPVEICKTSIPGSNPTGAYNFPVHIRSLVGIVCLEGRQASGN
jgi:hypothetical protein